MKRSVRVWRLLNLRCREMSRLSSESLDRELSFVEKLAVRSHSIYCGACRRYARQIERIRRVMRSFPERIELDEDRPEGASLPEEARERIKRALRER